MAPLRLKLLGGFEARLATGEGIELRSQRAQAVLAYLAMQPGRAQSRGALADLLWSDRDDAHARSCLRQALTALRKALRAVEPSPLAIDRNAVTLEPTSAEVDVVAFEALVAEGSPEGLAQAAELYAGDFLAGLAVHAPVFEDWLRGQRARLRGLVIGALGRLLADQAETGLRDEAVALAGRLIALDPAHEPAHRTLMRLYAQAGQREAALRQYQTCRKLLRREFAVEPDAETEQLVAAIRNGMPEPAARAVDAPAASRPAPVLSEHGGEAANEAVFDERGAGARGPWRWRRAALAAVLAVFAAGGLAAWLWPWESRVEPASEAKMAFPLPDRPSIAVLPFANLSRDPEQDYFAEGLTDDLITELAKLDGLFVIARNSSFAYKDKPVAIRQVAEALGVRFVLEGSVRRAGGQVRVNAQLIDALSGFHLWAERYDDSLDKVFALQDKIARDVAAALGMTLPAGMRAGVASALTGNPAAYDAFLRGWQYARIYDATEHAKAIAHLERAIELDPGYGRAYAALAHVYWLTFAAGWQKSLGLTQKEVMDLTVHYLRRAMKHPTPLAHSVALHVHYIRGEYEQGFAAAKKAIASGMADADSYDAMVKAYLYTGRPAEALEVLERGARLDPLNPKSFIWRRGQVLYHLGRFEQAAEQFRLALEVGDDFTDTHMYLAAAYGQLGKADEAQAEIARIKNKQRAEAWSYSVLSVDSWAFKSEKIRRQFRVGLRKAGLEEIPWGFDPGSPDLVRGADLRAVYVGRTIKGTDAQSGQDRWISIARDGMATSRIGDLVDTGVVDGWRDDKLCIWWQGEGRVCVVTFRNPNGAPERFDEYLYVYFGGVIPFSPIEE